MKIKIKKYLLVLPLIFRIIMASPVGTALTLGEIQSGSDRLDFQFALKEK